MSFNVRDYSSPQPSVDQPSTSAEAPTRSPGAEAANPRRNVGWSGEKWSLLAFPLQVAVPYTHNAASSYSPTLTRHGYQLEETLGTGSYSKVKVAYSNYHGRKVAIKIVTKSGASVKYLTKFLPREMQISKVVRHQNIIPFLQCMESTKRIYVVMELAVNGDLLTAIEKRHYIDEAQARIWFVQMLDGIEYLHSIGVVHRDLKCENILLDDMWCVRISDFGFSRFISAPDFLSDTYCGSYAYAAPEILKGIPYEPKTADIWSLGVILFAMSFGKLPFDDTNIRTLLRLVQNKVVFPTSPIVSNECKVVMTEILVESWNRPSIPQIRSLTWIDQMPFQPDAAMDLDHVKVDDID